MGKISVFAKGVRRLNNPMMAICQPLNFGEFELFCGRNSYSLTHATISNYFAGIKEDLETLYYAYYFAELCDYYGRENLDAKEMLKLLYQSLRALEHQGYRNDFVRYIFELRMLTIQGEAPNAQYIEKMYFNKYSKHITDTTLHAIDYIMSSQIEKLFTFGLMPEYIDELYRVVTVLKEKILNYKFSSLEQLELMKTYAIEK